MQAIFNAVINSNPIYMVYEKKEIYKNKELQYYKDENFKMPKAKIAESLPILGHMKAYIGLVDEKLKVLQNSKENITLGDKNYQKMFR